MSDFAKNLRRYRKRKNYSQEKLAKELHYGYTAIANYESGRNEPSIDDLIRLAKALNVTVDELIGMKFTSKEEELVACFLKLNEENQNRIMDLIQALRPENRKRGLSCRIVCLDVRKDETTETEGQRYAG